MYAELEDQLKQWNDGRILAACLTGSLLTTETDGSQYVTGLPEMGVEE